MNILRIQQVCAAVGYRSKSSIYNAVQAGFFTKPVAIGEKATGWPDSEVSAIVAARIAGQTPAQIKALVTMLHTARVDRFKAQICPLMGIQ